MRLADYEATFADAACLGRADEFTSTDNLDAHADLTDLFAVCIDCPVFDACEAYAREVKPNVGVWAGRRMDHLTWVGLNL